MPEVSIIMNCLNGEEFLSETLKTIKRQTFQDYEIIFLDNHSTDHTKDIALDFGEKLKYYCTGETIPLGAARNKALGLAKGKYIAFLDSDDLWAEDKLLIQVKVLNEHQNVGLVHSNFYVWNMLKGRTKIVHKRDKDRIDDFTEFICRYSYCMSTFMIRRELLDNMKNWFDGRFHYAEEYDFFSRLVYSSKAYYISSPLAVRRVHGEMNTIKYSNRIPIEHQLTLENLQKYIPDFDDKFPAVKKNINSIINYTTAKLLFPQGENKKIQKLMKPYLFYNKRTTLYFILSLFPVSLSKIIYKLVYYKSI